MDLALVQVNEAEFAGGANAFSPPGQDLLGRRDRLLVLAVPQVVAGAAVPVAQALHRSVHGRGADPDTQARRQHLAQVADAPDRDRQPVRLGLASSASARNASAAAFSLGGRPERGSSARPRRPPARNRARQARMRFGPVSNRRATAATVRPSATSSRACARRRTRGSGSVRVRPRDRRRTGRGWGPSQHLRPRRRTHRSKTSLRLLSGVSAVICWRQGVCGAWALAPPPCSGGPAMAYPYRVVLSEAQRASCAASSGAGPRPPGR